MDRPEQTWMPSAMPRISREELAADLRDQLHALIVRRRDLVWGDSDLTDPAVVADLASVQRQIDRLMTSYDARSLVAETRRAIDRRP